jgi:formate C-acetyltransferase
MFAISSNRITINIIGERDFLTAPTERTKRFVRACEEIFAREREKGGVLDIDTTTVSTITSHGPGYIDKENELVVGLQTDAPLRRAIKPFGGIRMVEAAMRGVWLQGRPE